MREENPIKIFMPSKNQIFKYKSYFIFVQISISILVIFGIETSLGLYSEMMAYIFLSIILFFILLKNLLFFNTKDIYEIALFKDKVVIKNRSYWLIGRTKKTLFFSNMEDVIYTSLPKAAGIFSHNSTQIYFKMLPKVEDFTLKSMGDDNFKKITEELILALNLYKNRVI